MNVFRDKLFAGKVALVTGGATGIGRGIAQALAQQGADVAIASRNRGEASGGGERDRRIDRPGACVAIVADVRQPEAVRCCCQSRRRRALRDRSTCW